MSTNFPGSLDNTTDLINDATDATTTATTHAQAHNNIADSIISIETVLGVNPNGSAGTVAARIAAVETGFVKLTPSTAQTIAPSADVVALTLKVGNNLDISNIFEAHLNDGTIVAFIDKAGNISAQSFKINGAAPTGSGGVLVLSNGPTINSPSLTGTPTAPTPTAGDNSTKVATTAFVDTAIAAATSLTINLETASYTLVASDAGKIIEINSATGVVLTVPNDSTTNFPVGTTITITQVGAGQITVAGATGVTVHANPGLKLAGQWAEAALYKRAADEWVLAGNLAP